MPLRGYFTADKGSVTVNRVSLAGCNHNQDTFYGNNSIYIRTYKLLRHKNRTKVSIKFDIQGKYIAKLNSLSL